MGRAFRPEAAGRTQVAPEGLQCGHPSWSRRAARAKKWWNSGRRKKTRIIKATASAFQPRPPTHSSWEALTAPCYFLGLHRAPRSAKGPPG